MVKRNIGTTFVIPNPVWNDDSDLKRGALTPQSHMDRFTDQRRLSQTAIGNWIKANKMPIAASPAKRINTKWLVFSRVCKSMMCSPHIQS